MLEESGIATCVYTQIEPFARLAAPPRLLVVEGTRRGFPLGEPGDRETQRRLVRDGLALIRSGAAGEVARVPIDSGIENHPRDP